MTQPNQPLGMSDFFALEAGEYLDRLDALLQGDAPPAADEFVRRRRPSSGRKRLVQPFRRDQLDRDRRHVGVGRVHLTHLFRAR